MVRRSVQCGASLMSGSNPGYLGCTRKAVVIINDLPLCRQHALKRMPKVVVLKETGFLTEFLVNSSFGRDGKKLTNP